MLVLTLLRLIEKMMLQVMKRHFKYVFLYSSVAAYHGFNNVFFTSF